MVVEPGTAGHDDAESRLRVRGEGRGLVLVLVLCACGARRDDRAPGSGHAESGPVCTDTLAEARALACSGGSARRAADTLYLRLRNGRDTTFVESRGEGTVGYRYAGRLGRGLHLIQRFGDESYPRWIVTSVLSGHRITFEDELVISPDSARFATAQSGWHNCSEGGETRFEIWRMTDTMPVLEWRASPTWSCSSRSGWAASDPRWKGRDTLAFLRNDVDAGAVSRRVPVVAVRGSTGWRVAGLP
jgi:hypothetical protein